MGKRADMRTPAQKAVDAWGGEIELAAFLGLDTSAVRQWLRRGGVIPARHQSIIVRAAKAEGKPFAVEDLLMPVER